jgi:hypothetical protein
MKYSENNLLLMLHMHRSDKERLRFHHEVFEERSFQERKKKE